VKGVLVCMLELRGVGFGFGFDFGVGFGVGFGFGFGFATLERQMVSKNADEMSQHTSRLFFF
jgi:hypothetical protein